MSKNHNGGVHSIRGEKGHIGYGFSLKDPNKSGTFYVDVHDKKGYQKVDKGSSKYSRYPITRLGKVTDSDILIKLRRHLEDIYKISNEDWEQVKKELERRVIVMQEKFEEQRANQYQEVRKEILEINPMMDIPLNLTKEFTYRTACILLGKLKKGVKGD